MFVFLNNCFFFFSFRKTKNRGVFAIAIPALQIALSLDSRLFYGVSSSMSNSPPGTDQLKASKQGNTGFETNGIYRSGNESAKESGAGVGEIPMTEIATTTITSNTSTTTRSEEEVSTPWNFNRKFSMEKKKNNNNI